MLDNAAYKYRVLHLTYLSLITYYSHPFSFLLTNFETKEAFPTIHHPYHHLLPINKTRNMTQIHHHNTMQISAKNTIAD